MRKLTIIPILLSSVACSTQSIYSLSVRPFDEILRLTNSFVDPELKPELLSFLQSCQLYPKSKKLCDSLLPHLQSVVYTDRFTKDDGTEDEHTVGRCTVYETGPRYVEIKRDYAEISSLTFKFLMQHELGHCLLDQGHAPKNSIHVMAPSQLTESSYQTNYKALALEVFQIFFPSDFKFELNKFSDRGYIVYEMHSDGTESIRKR